MLNDREREALRQLERQAMAEDPRFVSSFEAHMQGAGVGRTFLKLLIVTAIVIAAVTGAYVIVVTGSVDALLALAIVAGVGWVWWFMVTKSTNAQNPPS